MSRFAEPMARLIDELKKLPGVGSKSAQRLAFHILRSSEDDASALAGAIHDVKASLRLCSVCNNITDVDPCTYCSSATRNQHLICVVEEPTNIAAVEKTRHYKHGTTMAFITCCMERFRRSMALVPNNCGSRI